MSQEEEQKEQEAFKIAQPERWQMLHNSFFVLPVTYNRSQKNIKYQEQYFECFKAYMFFKRGFGEGISKGREIEKKGWEELCDESNAWQTVKFQSKGFDQLNNRYKDLQQENITLKEQLKSRDRAIETLNDQVLKLVNDIGQMQLTDGDINVISTFIKDKTAMHDTMVYLKHHGLIKEEKKWQKK